MSNFRLTAESPFLPRQSHPPSVKPALRPNEPQPPASTLQPPSPAAASRVGRPRALDGLKQHQILNLVFRGCTLEQAAYHVGCAASTIRREARRNPEFKEELNKMLLDAELFALNAVRGAAHSHWRAGRFLLEHMAAQRLREQKQHPLTPRQLRRFTVAITAALESEITDPDQRNRITDQLKKVFRDTNRNFATLQPSKPRRPKQSTSSPTDRAQP